MPTLNYSVDEIREKAAELGLTFPGEDVPNRHRGKVVAALAAERAATQHSVSRAAVPARITIQPDGEILVDGEPLPWLVARDRIEVTSNPDGPDTVRLTLLADHVSITDPAPKDESENRA